MKDNLYDTMIALAEQLFMETQTLLLQKGLKKNSDIMRSLEVRADADLIRLLSLDYLEYISTGRKPRAKKIPIRYILDFIKQNNLKGGRQTQQSLAFAIAKSIQKRRGGQMPPTQDLYGWMSKNRIVPKNISDNQLAFAIQNSIYRKGIKGKNFIEDLLNMYANTGEQKISADVEKEMLSILDNAKIN